MTSADFRYDDKRVVIVGGATGMGAAAARTVTDLGGEVVVLDVQDVSYPTAATIHVDLTDRLSVDAALEQIDGPIFALFSCAGVADGVRGLPLINFVAHRHIIERLVGDGRFAPSASVTLISSTAGIGWEHGLERVREVLATPDWDAAVQWFDDHPDLQHYAFSKQAVSAYVAHRAIDLGAHGVRLNAVLPGPTDTAFATGAEEMVFGVGQAYRDRFGRGPFEPDEMGDVVVFLGSNAARAITGALVTADLGQVSAAKLGLHPDEIVDFLLTL